MDDKLEILLNGQQYKKFQEYMFYPVTEKYRLTIFDLRVLLFLQNHKEHDTARDIVEIHYLTKSYVSKSIETLIERGYLKRKQDSHDRRYVHLELQEEAFPVIESARTQQIRLMDSLFRDITEEEIEVMRLVAQKITRNIAEVLE